jgi:hypothetical protein
MNLCPLHRRLDQAIAMVAKAFQHSSIEELVASSEGSLPLCPVPMTIKKKDRAARGQ